MRGPSEIYGNAIAEFQAHVETCTVKAVCGRRYIRAQELKSWFERKWSTGDSGEITQASRLLRVACGRYSHPGHPIPDGRLYIPGADCCGIIFSILLRIDAGQHIETLLRKDVTDRNLPISLLELNKLFRRANIPDYEKVASAFNAEQWHFRPIRFKLNMSMDYEMQQILPICRKYEINKGGTSKVWQIVVQEEFVDRPLRELLRQDPHGCYMDNEFGKVSRTQFQLKSPLHIGQKSQSCCICARV